MSLLPLPCSVSDHLALARRQVEAALVSPAAWRQLHAIVDPLPPCAEDAGLEVRLERGEARVDFSLCLRAHSPERRRLADAIAQSGVAAWSLGWRRAEAFLRAWGSKKSPLHDAVHALWLEFDADGPAPQPFVVFSLNEEHLYAAGTATPDALLAPVLAGICQLSEDLSPSATAPLERCLRALPRYAQLRHVAVRPTPAGNVVRLVVRMPWRRLPDTLVELGWPGDVSALRAMLQQLCPDTLVHAVNLDVQEDGLGPRVGVEFIHHGPPRASPRWKNLFEALESSGACAPERRAAVAGWGGENLGPALGPGVLCVRRDLMVKVIYQTGAPLRAKAYLAFAPRLLAIARPARPRSQTAPS